MHAQHLGLSLKERKEAERPARERTGNIERAEGLHLQTRNQLRSRPMEFTLNIDWAPVFWPSLGLLNVVVRGSIMYLCLFAILRSIGRRRAGTFGAADLLVIVLIADAAQNALGKEYESVTEGIALVLTIVTWERIIDWLAWRYPTLRSWIHAEPLKLISGGQLMKKNMRREMLSEEELMAGLREQGVDDVKRVKVAYLEDSGHLSVVKADSSGG